MSTTATQQLNKLYDSQLTSSKEQLAQSYKQGLSDLDARKQEAARQTQKNLTRTAVEAQQAQKNYGEVQNAYGLSSGAMSQARLAQDNQLQADLTALRAAQQTADDGIERQRALLSKQYTSAIAQAQAENDLARAKALYEEAKEQEKDLNQRKQDAAKLMASAGDFSLYQSLFGLTPEQVAALQRAYGGTVGTASGGSGGSGGDPGEVPPVEDPMQTIKDKLIQRADNYKDATLGTINGYVSTRFGETEDGGSNASAPAPTTPVTGTGSTTHTSPSGTLHGGAGRPILTLPGLSNPNTQPTAPAPTQPEKSSAPDSDSVSRDVQEAVQAGRSLQSISEYIRSAVSAGYITKAQGNMLMLSVRRQANGRR